MLFRKINRRFEDNNFVNENSKDVKDVCASYSAICTLTITFQKYIVHELHQNTFASN